MFIAEVINDRLVFRTVKAPEGNMETVCRISRDAATVVDNIAKTTGLTRSKIASAMIMFAAERCEIEGMTADE